MRTLTRARSKRQVYVPPGRKLSKIEVFDPLGLNTTTPHDPLEPNKSPYLNNARIQEQEVGERRSAIRSRKGASFYTVPLGETANVEQASTTSASFSNINTVHWTAQDFTPSASGRLTKLELNLRNPSGAIGNIIVEICENNSGVPGTILATSSIEGSEMGETFAYEIFRFIEAPLLASGTKYWIVAHLQTGGQNHYEWSTTTNTTTGLESNTSGDNWEALSASANFKTYLSTDGPVKGIGRYYPVDNDNTTLFAHGTNVYRTNDVTGATTSIESGLDSDTTSYDFGFSLDKAYWVNGFDVPMQYDGTSTTDLGGSPSVATMMTFHKNRMFIVPTDDPTKLEFSDLGDYETWGAVSFLYVPAPQTSDPIVKILSFQDSLAILNKNSKWVLSGSDLATFNLRQAIGKNGAVAKDAVDSDENYIYYLGSDKRFYRWNGAEDEDIGWMIQSEFDDIPDENDVSVRCWKNQVRVYCAGGGDSNNTKCLIFDKTYNEWLRDTDALIKHTAILFKDDNKLVEASHVAGALYYAEQQDSILGKPIEFEYRTKYHSFGNSGAKKQIRRFYPLFRSQDAPFEVNIQVDKDFRDRPKDYFVDTQGIGETWGGGAIWGDGSTYGKTELTDPRITISGQAVYFQIRFIHTGADQPVEFLGYILYYRLKRPK